MSWIFFALLSRFLWSGCNALDQVLSRAHTHHKTKSVLVLQLVMYVPFCAVAGLMSQQLAWNPTLMLWSLLGFFGYIGGLGIYYYVLQREHAHNIVPLFEFVPVMLTLMAILIRHEQPTALQQLGIFLVIISGFAFSWDFEKGKIKTNILLLMAVCSLCYATYQLSLRGAADYADTWGVMFWFILGQCLGGVLAFAVLKPVRQSILSTARATRGKTLLLCLITTVLAFGALASLIHAFVTAPTTGHVAGLSGTQPFFSFGLAWFLGHFWPEKFPKIGFNHETKLKILLIGFIFVGIYLLT